MAEPVDIDGMHPSHRDLRNLLQARYGTARTAADAASTSRPTLTAQVEDVIDGEVLGWSSDEPGASGEIEFLPVHCETVDQHLWPVVRHVLSDAVQNGELAAE